MNGQGITQGALESAKAKFGGRLLAIENRLAVRRGSKGNRSISTPQLRLPSRGYASSLDVSSTTTAVKNDDSWESGSSTTGLNTEALSSTSTLLRLMNLNGRSPSTPGSVTDLGDEQQSEDASSVSSSRTVGPWIR